MKRLFTLLLAAMALACTPAAEETPKPQNQEEPQKPSGTEEYSVTTSPASLTFDAQGGKLSFVLTCDAPGWTIECEDDWLTVTPDRGRGNQTVYVEAEAWTSTQTERQSTLLISATSGKGSIYLPIVQNKATGTDPGPGPDPDPELSVTVTTGNATGITLSTAVLDATYASATATVREVGFDWGLSASDLSEQLQAQVPGSGTSGEFYELLEGLEENHTYYYRAYVTLQSGETIKTFTGSVKSFATPKGDSPQPGGSQPGWYELPVMNIQQSGNYMVNASNTDQYYAWHISPDVKGPGGKLARNYTVCYGAQEHCPVWVAAPRHSMYTGSTKRTDAYKQDPNIPGNIQYSSKSTGGGCNKGHMLGSAERTCSRATNEQVFYYTNIAPQLSSGFNTGGGGWNILEDYVDSQVCADTLYEVLGCYFKTYTDAYGKTQTPKTISFGSRNDVSMPTMFYYVLLRTKKGNSGKSVKDCSASELQCVAFVRAHSNDLKGQEVTSKELMSVADLEKITGVTYFPNIPNAPKTSFSVSDWGL